MINKIYELLKKEEGAETMEYVVIVSIIIILGFLVYDSQFGAVVSNAFTHLTDAA